MWPLIPLFRTSGDISSGWVLPYSSLAEAYVLYYTFPVCDTCQPLGGQHGSQAISSTYLRGIGGTGNRELSYHRSQCEIRQTLYRLSYQGSTLFKVLDKKVIPFSQRTAVSLSDRENRCKTYGPVNIPLNIATIVEPASNREMTLIIVSLFCLDNVCEFSRFFSEAEDSQVIKPCVKAL